MDWREIANTKQEQRWNRIPPAWRFDASVYADQLNVLKVPQTCGILTAKEIAITENYDAVSLVDAIKEGQLSSEEVAVAFCKRAAIAQQLVHGGSDSAYVG